MLFREQIKVTRIEATPKSGHPIAWYVLLPLRSQAEGVQEVVEHMEAEAGISITVKRALTPQKGGFLASGFTHTLNPYVGCTFGRVGCPFCYVRESL